MDGVLENHFGGGGWIADLGGSGGEWNASVKREFIVVER